MSRPATEWLEEADLPLDVVDKIEPDLRNETNDTHT